MKEENLHINDNPEREKWNAFVYQHPQGNIFQTSFMYDVYQLTPSNNAGVISLESADGTILGLVVFVLISEPGMKRHFSTRAIITGGPLIKNNDLAYARTLLSNYLKKIKKTKAIYTEVRNLFNIEALNSVFIGEKFKYEQHLTIHQDLSKSKDDLLKALHRGRASNIKRAVKKNVTTKDITTNEDICTAYNLIKESYGRIGLPSPPVELFLNASEIIKNNIKFYAAYLDNKIIGCRVYLIYKDVIYDWYAATDREYSGYQASDLLPWNAMMWAKDNGFKIYDFAGAGKPDKEYSVRDYKLKFGGNLLNFGRYQYIHNPILYQLGVVGLKFYKYIN